MLAGEIYLAEGLASKLLRTVVGGYPDAEGGIVETLSDRELEVFELIGKALATRQIAEKLHVSVKTVEAHRASIKEKLQLENATALAHAAFQWVKDRTEL